MIRIINYILFSGILLYSAYGRSQDTNTVELHIQLYDEGASIPVREAVSYSASRYQKLKQVFVSETYFSTIYVSVKSKDSAEVYPQINHKLQSFSLQFNPKLDYELIIGRYDGFDKSSPEIMVIEISNLENDAQLMLPFKKGDFVLQKMKYFEAIQAISSPQFQSENRDNIKNNLKLDSTAYFLNGNKKAKYYVVTDQFPLYYVEEFDSINSSFYSQGFRLLTNRNGVKSQTSQPVWTIRDNTKYGYWEYFENGKRVKHELWTAVIKEKYEFYPTGQLKSEFIFGDSNTESKYTYYLENGNLKEEFFTEPKTRKSYIKSYVYSPQGTALIINIYNSSNGRTRQGLHRRELFYPSGKLKMEENFDRTYDIKYYNEDGTRRIK
jgi:antitoxin component YwqK of YwqJK toxin-antitoxin module